MFSKGQSSLSTCKYQKYIWWRAFYYSAAKYMSSNGFWTYKHGTTGSTFSKDHSASKYKCNASTRILALHPCPLPHSFLSCPPSVQRLAWIGWWWGSDSLSGSLLQHQIWLLYTIGESYTAYSQIESNICVVASQWNALAGIRTWIIVLPLCFVISEEVVTVLQQVAIADLME